MSLSKGKVLEFDDPVYLFRSFCVQVCLVSMDLLLAWTASLRKRVSVWFDLFYLVWPALRRIA